MSVETTLKAEARDGTGKGAARKLRAAGRLPAVVYGGESEPVHISLDAHDAEYLFRNISVDNTIVDLELPGEKESAQTLVREIQAHPWKPVLLHVDFLRIQKGVTIDVNIPLQLVGTPVGVQLEGGQLDQIIYDLPIRCIPSKIPEIIEVDVSGMNLHDVMHISDLTFDEGIEVAIAPERTICAVSLQRAEEAAAADEEDEDGEDGAPATDAPEAAADSGDEG